LTPASIIPVFGSQRPYADLNFAGGSFGLDGRSVSNLTALPGFTFTRASLAMGYDATGKLVYGPNNLCLQSQTFDNATWTAQRATVTANATAAPDGTLTADKLIEDATASNTHRITQTPTTAASAYTWSVYAKADTRSWLYLRVDRIGPTTPIAWFNVSNGTVGTVQTGFTASIQSVGNGWYRCTATVDVALAGANSIMIGLATADNVSSYTGDGTSGIFIWGAQLEAVTYQTTPSTYNATTTAAYYGPRLVYDPVTLASQGILVEEARTNLLLQSQDFATTWAVGGATVPANATTSPDGTNNADKLAETVALTTHSIVQTVTKAASAITYTGSCYIKAAGRNCCRFVLGDATLANYASASIDLSAVTISSTVFGTGWTVGGTSITAVGGGWYRVVFTVTSDATTSIQFRLYAADSTGGVFYLGDGTSGLFLYQAQLEAGTGASSPIPTTTAAVTRTAEDVGLTGLSVTGGFTLVTTGRGVVGFTGTAGVAAFGDGTTANRLTNYTTSAGVTLNTFAAVGGSGAAASSGTTTAGAAFTQAASFDGVNRIATSGNGAAVATATVAVNPASLNQLRIGTTASVSSELRNGTISRIRIYNRALPNAQLQSLTT
jgi:hypothetical protein